MSLTPLDVMPWTDVKHSRATEQSWSLSLPWKIASGGAHTGIYKGLGTTPTSTDQATLWSVAPYLIQQMLRLNLFQIPSDFICNLHPSSPIVGAKQNCCGLWMALPSFVLPLRHFKHTATFFATCLLAHSLSSFPWGEMVREIRGKKGKDHRLR